MAATISFVSLPDNVEDLTGRRFSDLVVQGPISRGPLRWLCKCDCGNFTTALGPNLKARGVQSCGCLRSKAGEFLRTHGRSHTPEYRAWIAMRKRCYMRSDPSYKYYGGRGITVDPRWNRFEDFFADMGARPSPKHTLDRIDVNGNYAAENCRWATHAIQASNKRNTIVVDINGKRLLLADAAKMSGIHASTIIGRIRRGWSHADAVSKRPSMVANFLAWHKRK